MIVTAEVRVPPGESLSILPGVEVLFSVYCKLIVDNAATLRAVGTPADSIRFDVLPPNPNWHGIRFLAASDSSRLEYCTLKHGMATGSGEDNKGGAIYCSGTSPTISGNTLSGNSASYGGGIYCHNSSPIIIGNTINGNSASLGGGIACEGNSNPIINGNAISENYGYAYGGGIFCHNSSPSINDNTISGNSAGSTCMGGGISCGNNSNPTISGNTISGNIAIKGCGIYCISSNPTISGNTISGNSQAFGAMGGQGGGIHCDNSSPIIEGNTISGNNGGGYDGGGIFCSDSSPIIISNSIIENYAMFEGGGIFCESNTIIRGNTISGNYALFGGGICCYGNVIITGNTISRNYADVGGGISCIWSDATLVNCIIWENTTDQIRGTPNVSYSDIQGGYTGTGNINAWPAFVDTAQGDYRLQWGSPCIDTGDPNPIYNDPDGSRADMGAWYYDQTMPVRILLTPYNAPIQIPASGGSFQYAIQATNIESDTLSALVWCNVTLPSGTIYGPVLGPVTIEPGAGQTLSRVRTQVVPAGAPAGLYHYNAYAVAAGDTSEDSFTFTKLGTGGWNLEGGDWANTGEEFSIDVGAQRAAPALPARLKLSVRPNPFNPLTVLGCQLPVAGYVNLRIYDTAGRLVTTLADGWRAAGSHEIAFDGSDLPSGIYVYRLEAGEFAASGKMVLVR